MKAILKNGQLRYQNQFKVVFDIKGNQTSTNGFKDQDWLDWGFKEVVDPVLTLNQVLGDWYEGDTEITRYVIDKTEETIATELAEEISQAIRKFERDTDILIKEVVGERSNEYLLAETEANSFKDAGYPEDNVPGSVSSDAIANGYSSQVACDIILVMAVNWRAMQMALRSNRLLSKAQVKAVTLVSEIAPIKVTWEAFLVTLRAQIME